MNPRSKPKGSFAFKIAKKRGVFTLMIGMRGNLDYIPMSQSAYASRMPLESFVFQTGAEAQTALASARAWLNA